MSKDFDIVPMIDINKSINLSYTQKINYKFGVGVGVGVVAMCMFFALSIAQLAIGNAKQSQCNAFILPNNWLIVDASVYLFFFTSCFTLMYLKHTTKDRSQWILPLITIVCLSFIIYFMWNVIGSIMFWRDCVAKEYHQPLNVIMNVTLISQYIVLLVIICALYIDY